METHYADVVAHFVERSQGARDRLEAWQADPHKSEVVPHVENAVTRVAYGLSPADIERVSERTDHALGTVRRAVAESVAEVVDWHPSFAFEHVLHHATEILGHVPTYQEFRELCDSDPTARRMLLAPAQERRQLAEAGGHAPENVRAALQWRIGNAYLSYLRELYVLAVLRDAGLDARCHVLADVLLRVDCWIGDLCLAVYVSNERFRAGPSGRKPSASAVLGDGPFTFTELQLRPRREYGTVHLPDRTEILSATRALIRNQTPP